MNKSQFLEALTSVKNLENSIRILVGENQDFDVLTDRSEVKQSLKLFSNVIPLQYLLKEYYRITQTTSLQTQEEALFILRKMESYVASIQEALKDIGSPRWLFKDDLNHVFSQVGQFQMIFEMISWECLEMDIYF